MKVYVKPQDPLLIGFLLKLDDGTCFSYKFSMDMFLDYAFLVVMLVIRPILVYGQGNRLRTLFIDK